MNDMTQFVVKVDADQLDEVMVTLLDQDRTKRIKVTNRYEAFRIVYAGSVIVGYTSGKIVASGPESERLLKSVVSKIDVYHDFDVTIGSDEAGKGEWLGPLVISAVAIDQEMERELKSAGVMDSKDLDEQRIGELAYVIEENNLCIETVLISPEKFNRQLQEFHDEGKNLNDFLAWAHAKAISLVMKSIKRLVGKKRIRIIVDEFAKEKAEDRLRRVVDLNAIELVQIPHAESHVAVAAASIMARDAREDWIDRKSGELGIELQGISKERARKHEAVSSFAKTKYLGI